MRDLFSGDFDTIHLAGWRYESWNDPILWILSHSGGTQVEDMLQRCLKETQRPPLTRASWLMLFCCAPMKEIHPAAKPLTWNECFYGRGKKNKKTCLALWLRLKFGSAIVWIIQDQGAGWVTHHAAYRMEQFALKPRCRVQLDHTFDQVTCFYWVSSDLRDNRMVEMRYAHFSVCSLSVYLHFWGHIPRLRPLFRSHRGTPVGVVFLDCPFLTLNC